MRRAFPPYAPYRSASSASNSRSRSSAAAHSRHTAAYAAASVYRSRSDGRGSPAASRAARRLGERQEGAVAVRQFAVRIRRRIQVPAGERAARHGDVRQADAGALVAVRIHLRHQRAPCPRRRLRIGPVRQRRHIVRRARRASALAPSAAPPPRPAPACRRRCAAAGCRAARGPSPPTHPAPPADARTAGIGSCQLRGLTQGPLSRGMFALPPCCVPASK